MLDNKIELITKWFKIFNEYVKKLNLPILTEREINDLIKNASVQEKKELKDRKHASVINSMSQYFEEYHVDIGISPLLPVSWKNLQSFVIYYLIPSFEKYIDIISHSWPMTIALSSSDYPIRLQELCQVIQKHFICIGQTFIESRDSEFFRVCIQGSEKKLAAELYQLINFAFTSIIPDVLVDISHICHCRRGGCLNHTFPEHSVTNINRNTCSAFSVNIINCEHDIKCLLPGINSKHRQNSNGLIVKNIELDNLLFDKEGFILIYGSEFKNNFNPILKDNIDLNYYTVEYSNCKGKFFIHGKGLVFLALIYSMEFNFKFDQYYYEYYENDINVTTKIVNRFEKLGRRNFTITSDNFHLIPSRAFRTFIRPYQPYEVQKAKSSKDTMKKRNHVPLSITIDPTTLKKVEQPKNTCRCTFKPKKN